MLTNKLLENNPLWLVDVGASGGIDPRWKRFTSSYKAILFEPDPREYDNLKSKSENNTIVLNSALSDSAKVLEFHLCRKQQVSSIYLPNVEFLNMFPCAERFDVVKTIKMEADTLSNQLKKNNISEIDFIKLDTQGYEMSILKGGIDYLPNVIGLEIEVEFSQIYKDQPLFNEVDSLIKNMNFVLFDIKRYYWRRNESKQYGSRKGQLIFGDALYLKTPEQIFQIKAISQEKIIRAICIYLVYGYPDLAHTLFSQAKRREDLEIGVHSIIELILSNFEDKVNIPNFKGKDSIFEFFKKIANCFQSKEFNTGTDRFLGNS